MEQSARKRKPLEWVASSREDLRRFPEDVQDEMGFALYQAELGRKHRSAKPLKGFGGAGVPEVRGGLRRQHIPRHLYGEVSTGGLRAALLPEEVNARDSDADAYRRSGQAAAETGSRT